MTTADRGRNRVRAAGHRRQRCLEAAVEAGTRRRDDPEVIGRVRRQAGDRGRKRAARRGRVRGRAAVARRLAVLEPVRLGRGVGIGALEDGARRHRRRAARDRELQRLEEDVVALAGIPVDPVVVARVRRHPRERVRVGTARAGRVRRRVRVVDRVHVDAVVELHVGVVVQVCAGEDGARRRDARRRDRRERRDVVDRDRAGAAVKPCGPTFPRPRHRRSRRCRRRRRRLCRLPCRAALAAAAVAAAAATAATAVCLGCGLAPATADRRSPAPPSPPFVELLLAEPPPPPPPPALRITIVVLPCLMVESPPPPPPPHRCRAGTARGAALAVPPAPPPPPVVHCSR